MEHQTIIFTEREKIVREIASKVFNNNGRLEFHGGSYSDGQVIETTDGNHYHIVNIYLNERENYEGACHLKIELWSKITENFYAYETELTDESLESILKEIHAHETSVHRSGSQQLDKDRLLKETIALLSADIYSQVYEHSCGWGEAVESIVNLAEEFEKELNWQLHDERDYIEELERFERKVIEEKFS